MTDSARSQYTSGLRKLADMLDANPDVPLPYNGASATHGELLWILAVDGDQRGNLARIARMIPGSVRKEVRGSYFDLVGSIDGLHFKVIADRDEVCERIVTGTETVTRNVPDPSVVVPTVEVTETVETVEWRCAPIMAAAE